MLIKNQDNKFVSDIQYVRLMTNGWVHPPICRFLSYSHNKKPFNYVGCLTLVKMV